MTSLSSTPPSALDGGQCVPGDASIRQNGPATWASVAPPKPVSGLAAFFSPRSVAVIGASERQGSVGRALAENLLQHRGDRAVHLVNPKHTTLFGRPCHASVGELGAPVDLAVIAVPAAHVLEVVGACGAAGIPAAVVISAGFDEVGPAGQQLGQDVRRCARTWGMRVIGPNCMGLIDAHTWLNASFALGMPKAGGLALLSQSGAVGSAMLDWSRQERIGFRAFVSTGTMLDVSWPDLIEFFGHDPDTAAILIYMEAIGDARAFLSAAREVSARKPIVVIKAGRSPNGAHAAQAHTGAEAGDDAVMDAAFAAAGVMRVESLVDLFAVAEVLSIQPRPAGRRLAILTNGGGLAVLAADATVGSGLEVAKLAPGTIARLDRLLPAHWSHGDPVDVLGDADAERYAQAASSILDDPNVDGLLALLAPQGLHDHAKIAGRLADVALVAKKTVLSCWMGGPTMEESRHLLRARGIPTFLYPETAVRAFAHIRHNTEDLERLDETPVATSCGHHDTALSEGADIIATATNQENGKLADTAARQLLAAYGLGEHDDDREAGSERPRGAPAAGLRVRISSWTDAHLGPVIAIGWGGVHAELGQRLAVALPPISSASAMRLILRTDIARALERRDVRLLTGLVEAMCAAAHMASEQRRIRSAEIDLLLDGRGPQLEQASIALQPHGAQAPSPAIRPYPYDYATFMRFADYLLYIRPIRPDDENMLARFHAGLSEETVRLRYFYAMGLSARISHPRLGHLCHADYDRELALVAELPGVDGMDRIVAVARLNRDSGDPATAELAVVIDDAWQRKGLGRYLVRQLIQIAPHEGYGKIVAVMLPENAAMTNLLRSEGFEIANDGETGMTRAWRLIEPATRAS